MEWAKGRNNEDSECEIMERMSGEKIMERKSWEGITEWTRGKDIMVKARGRETTEKGVAEAQEKQKPITSTIVTSRLHSKPAASSIM